MAYSKVKPTPQSKIDKKQATSILRLKVKPIIKANKNTRIPAESMQYITKKLAQAKHIGISKEQLSKQLNISLWTLHKAYKENKDLYFQYTNELQNSVKSQALLKCQLALKSIKKAGLNDLNALQQSQASLNLYKVATEQPESTNIQVNIQQPQSREELLSYILEGTKSSESI